MEATELFHRIAELVALEPSVPAIRYLHETLVLACAEALRGTRQGFGNLFSQVDYLCKQHGIAMNERIAIQQMRRHSNGREVLNSDDWHHDLRALALFVSAVFHVDVPHQLVILLPAEGRPVYSQPRVNLRYMRCIVNSWDDHYLYTDTSDGPVCIELTDDSLLPILSEGMQLNLLDSRREGTNIQAGLIVVEPDFLVDISAIAACFQDYGHHPSSYLLNRLKPRANSQPILLGNFAGDALDSLIHSADFDFADTLRASFSSQALQFCTLEGFDGERFKTDAQQQVSNIREAVNVLFDPQGPDADSRLATVYDRKRALLEPSFVCERLGLQGRVDLMTDDMRLLVEQKSGRNWNIERPQDGQKGLQREDHYVQLLLYYGVLRYNFQLTADRVDIRLLYSKYPARQGLLVVNYYQQLFREAIRVRNCIVAQEIAMARHGCQPVLSQLNANQLLENSAQKNFFDRYIRGDIERIIDPLRHLQDYERDYVGRMMTFVYREQLAQKIGVQEGQSGAYSDLWNMPLSEKLETGSILTGPVSSASDTSVVLAIDTSAVLPNFRRGDMVYIYRYDGEPDVRTCILYKGVITLLTDTSVSVHLNDAQHNQRAFESGMYAVEHAASDVGTTSALRSIHAFCCARQERRDLLLGRRAPRRDASLQLSHSYHAHFDPILLRAKQSLDYFLLQGPPGTGKTSQALRFLVEEELGCSSVDTHLLLTAYTNRAVDEICAMLTDAHIDYLRIGHEASCDPRFAPHLLEQAISSHPRMVDIRHRLQATRVVVSTISTLQTRPSLLQLMHFSLCFVDEASQILEPNIIGLLTSDSISRFILIGDHKQLPAVVVQNDDEPQLHTCRQSLFERLLRQEQLAGRTDYIGILRRQGRMHPDIAQFPNDMFYQREQLQPVPLPHQQEEGIGYNQPSADELDDLLKLHRVLFLPVSTQPIDAADNASLSDKVSPAEARMVADLLRRIYRQTGSECFDANRTIGIIVPYRNQIAMIRREIARLEIPALQSVSIDTVERYQGSQRDVIIYSFTIQHPYQLDFLTANCFEEDGHIIDRKLNVAMTRARKQLLMTGRPDVLRRNALFNELINRFTPLRHLALMLLCLLSLCCYGQSEAGWQEDLQQWMTAEDMEESYGAETLEQLEERAAAPFNLNQLTREELEELPFLSATQVESILEYVFRYGPVRSKNELSMIGSLDKETRRLLTHFVYIGEEKPRENRLKLSDIFSGGKHSLMATVKVPMYSRKGDRTSYLGYKYRHDLRYQFNYRNRIKAGLTAAQDAGEPFFANKNRMGYDHYAYYFQLRDMGRIEELNVGMYRVQMGMGLVMNTGFRLGKLSTLQSMGRSSHLLTAHSSRSQAGYLHGAAATIRIGRSFKTTAFVSHRAVDATLNADGSVRTLLNDGYHRTPTEMAKKNNTRKTDIGGSVQWRKGKLYAGANAVFTHFNRELQPQTANALYRRYAASGNDFLNLSLDYGYSSTRLTVSGETALNRNGALAMLHSVGYRWSSNFSMLAVHRYYDKRYTTLYGRAFGEGSSVQNEHGIYLGATWRPLPSLLLQGYADYAHFPWARYLVNAPSDALDAMVTALYQKKCWTLEGRYRFRLRQRNNEAKTQLANRTEHRLRLAASCLLTAQLTLRTRADAALMQKATGASRGVMVGQQADWRWRWLRIGGFVGWFCTDDYDSRLYQYEPSVSYDYAFAAFYGRGIRYSIMATAWAGKRLRLTAKVGATDYFDRSAISTGTQQVGHSSMIDLLLQGYLLL